MKKQSEMMNIILIIEKSNKNFEIQNIYINFTLSHNQ